jgi:predicted ester cyclase
MSTIRSQAEQFVEACDSGKGWEVCKAFCHPDATFACQAAALADVSTVEGYTEWAKGLLTPIPDGRYDLKSLAVDEARNSVAAFAVFHGTQTGEGGPVPPTGKTVASEYVYIMEFEGDRIRRITKVWNDAICLQQLGWA